MGSSAPLPIVHYLKRVLGEVFGDGATTVRFRRLTEDQCVIDYAAGDRTVEHSRPPAENFPHIAARLRVMFGHAPVGPLDPKAPESITFDAGRGELVLTLEHTSSHEIVVSRSIRRRS